MELFGSAAAAAMDETRQWVADAKADGWELEPTYGDSEPIERAVKGRREGFVFMATMRPAIQDDPRPWMKGVKDSMTLNVWGPDGMALSIPRPYSFERLRIATRKCNYCEREDVDVKRVGFAGRVCAACDAEVRKRVEYPGWTN
jgi:hypothetical protein